jgi:hypothetical protein
VVHFACLNSRLMMKAIRLVFPKSSFSDDNDSF